MPKFREAGIELYAISYDDRQALAAFADSCGRPGDLPAYGVPFPGTFVTDENGVVIEKFFHDSYEKRNSAESMIDAALGGLLTGGEGPAASGSDDDVAVSAFVRGGRALREGLHLYGETVPEGMLPTRVEVAGPEGLVTLAPELPPTRPHRLEALGLTLHVWDGVVDIAVPFYPRAELISECRPLDRDSVPIHGETGQRKAALDGAPHLRRLMWRQLRRHPLGALRSIVQQIRLRLEAQRRRSS
jgi:hypothetical protein